VPFPENSIVSIEVRVLYDDMSETSVVYDRASVQMN